MKRFPLNKAWFWETAPFFRLLLTLIAGITAYTLSRKLHGYDVLIIGAALSFTLLLVTGFMNQKQPVIKYLFTVAVHACIFLMALLLCFYNDVRNNQNWFGKRLAGADACLAKISGTPEEKGLTWKLEVEVLNSIEGKKVKPVIGGALVYVYKNAENFTLHEGDTVLLPAEWQRIRNAGNPFEFDYAGYCARNNLYYQQFIGRDKLLLYAKANPGDIHWIKRLHNRCMQILEQYIKDKAALGLIQAMLVGDDINFDPELRQVYADTGIIHIVAISGSHIAMFFALIVFLLGWIKHKKYHWLKYAVAVPLVWIYVLMAGAPPSAVRAAAMFTILGVGFALQKNPNSLNLLFAAAFILLCAQPMWLFSVGFQLSFLAVLSLILFYRPVYKLWSLVHFIPKSLWQVVAASMAAEILIAPMVIYYFHIFPLMFIVANVVAWAFMGIVLFGGMLIIAFGFVPIIASGIAFISVRLVSVFNHLILWLKQFNPESFYFLHLKAFELVLIYIIIGALGILILKKRKTAIFVCLSAACLLFASFCYNEWMALHQQRLVVYNISKANHIERVNGRYYTVVSTDSAVSQKKKDYILKPAHTGWHAWRSAAVIEKEILWFGNQSILVLDKQPQYIGNFPVDYVIVNYNAKQVIPEQLDSMFHPRKIVLGTEVSRRKAAEWTVACKQHNMALHNIMYDGAFILEGF